MATTFVEPSVPALCTSDFPSPQNMESLGIYVQFPFCASKCSFCNFSSRVEPASVFDAYCRAIEQEIDRLPAYYEADKIGRGIFDRLADTVYVGGGTPSLLGSERLERIFSGLRRRFELSACVEFTLEVTPGSASDRLLERARALGVNRLSIGAQSFDDRELRLVGRLHSAAETRDLVRRARGAGFANLSLDLIAGLPSQNETSWLHSVRETVQLQPEHISVFSLRWTRRVASAPKSCVTGRAIMRRRFPMMTSWPTLTKPRVKPCRAKGTLNTKFLILRAPDTTHVIIRNTGN